MSKFKKPNLFIIGAMKSGTTYLHDLLSAHPDIYMSKVKEPCFFVKSQELKKFAPSMWNMGISENDEKYYKLFENIDNEKIIGESSTLYTKYPTLSGIPERISNFNPDSKFIYVMRDPVERTLSHFWHNVRVESKMVDVYEGVISDPHYINVSNYASQINEYFKYFNKDQFFFCTFEDLVESPNLMLSRLFDWLDVDSTYEVPDIDQPKNVTPEDFYVSRHGIFPYRIRNIKLIRKLIDIIPYSFRQTLSKPNKDSVDKKTVEIGRIVEYLKPIQREQTEELKNLIGTDFPQWKTLYSELQ